MQIFFLIQFKITHVHNMSFKFFTFNDLRYKYKNLESVTSITIVFKYKNNDVLHNV